MSPKPKNTSHRVLLSLPTDLYETISRVSAAMEKPRDEIVRDLLGEQQPILEHMATMLEQAKAGKLDQAMKGWKKMAGEALKGLGVIMNPPEWAVRHLNWSNKLPCVRQGRRVLFDTYDMDRFIENNQLEGQHGDDLSTQETRSDDKDFGRTGPMLDEALH